MYEKITISALLSAYIFTSASILATSPTSFTFPELTTEADIGQSTPSMKTGEVAVTSDTPFSLGPSAPRSQLVHIFSEPVIIAIVLGVIAAIVGIILSFAVCIRLLTRTSPVTKPPPLEDTGEHLSTVEVEYTGFTEEHKHAFTEEHKHDFTEEHKHDFTEEHKHDFTEEDKHGFTEENENQ
ncbi:PREDICTED: glycophorin-A isoform X2 [Chinchilla lanigera]|uniref:glycophorin-A isoform X2 n=1 Tax=Chinchilla lanigera TaxID=34839 RepID=UPI0006965348|nr:PREDICTED: glycophorin-A isoform X2 [Chinchilla lanigera]